MIWKVRSILDFGACALHASFYSEYAEDAITLKAFFSFSSPTLWPAV